MVGMWVVLNNDEGYHIGYIKSFVGENHVLVRLRPHIKELSNVGITRLVCLCDLADPDDFSCLFETEKELDAYIAWVETPDDDKPKIVALKKPTSKDLN